MVETTQGDEETPVDTEEVMPFEDSLSPGRIEALSDGVIAIAITLLVLELSIPHLSGHAPEGVPTSLWDMRTELYSYSLGFMSLGVYWILHHYIFHFIKRSNGVLVVAEHHLPVPSLAGTILDRAQ